MKIFQTITILAATLMMAGCGDFLKESSQDTDYVNTWNDLDELLIGDCYMPVHGSYSFLGDDSGSNNYGSFLHLIADEMQEITEVSGLQVFDKHEREFGYFTWQQRVGQNETYSDFFTENSTWTKVYKCINVANNVLKSADDVPQSTTADKQGVLKVRGEAHFLRGFYYFWLTNLYGKPYDPATAKTDLGVPLKTSEEVQDVKFGRNTVQECYDQVLADLLQAESELSQVTTPKKSIYRADSTAVNLLLSRVYLYMQNWNKAAEYARKVIAVHPALQNLGENAAKFAQKSNVENIFSMGGDDVPLLLQCGVKGMAVSQGLYSSYSANDLRRSQWYWSNRAYRGVIKAPEGSVSNPVPTTDNNYYYYVYNNALSGSKLEVSSLFWLRSAEAYLNLAEAEAYAGNEPQARAALLTLMKCRYATGAPELNVEGKSGENLVSLIREERRREFAFEGQRWFDLRRYRVCEPYPSKISITHDYTYYEARNSTKATETHRFVLTQDDASWTLPIPAEVLKFNTGMKNNDNQWRTYTVVSK